MSNFNYSVAIRLTVANLASQGIKMLGKDLLAAHGQAVALQDKLSALKMIGVGFGMEKVGQGILGFMHKAVDVSKEYTSQLSLMNAAGFTHKELAGSIAAAWSTSQQVITSSATDNLIAIKELRTAFGAGEGMQHAYAVLPTVQRAKAIMEALTGKPQEGVAFDMVKAIEFSTKGAVSVGSLTKQSEMMTKALLAYQGTLTVADFHSAFKQLKTAAPYLTDDFKYTILPTLIQEMKSGHGGGQAAGTAIATLFGTIKGHAIQTRMIPAWQAAGLIAPGGIVVDKHHKGVSRIGPGGIAGEDLFTQDPLAWAQKYLIPARDLIMKKMHTDEVGAYYSLTGNRNSAFMMQTLVNKSAQIKRDQDLINRVGSSYGAYQKLLASNPQLAEQALHAQMNNVYSIIGYQILPKILPLMVDFAKALNSISMVMQRHPLRTEWAVIGFTALGGALDLVGKALMTAGVIKFLGLGSVVARVLPRLAMVGGALTGVGLAAFLLYNNWKEISRDITSIWRDLGTSFKELFGGHLISAFSSFKHAWLLGWQVLFNTLIAGLNTLPFVNISKFHFADQTPMHGYVPHQRNVVVVHGNMVLDGKSVGKVMMPHLLREMDHQASRPNQGTSTFDPRRAWTPPSLAAR